MRTFTYSKTIQLPDIDDVIAKYPRYTQLLAGEGRLLLDVINQPEALIEAQVLADFGLPSVLAVAARCSKAIASRAESPTLGSFTKQFIGAAVCVLMEANGYQKTGIKKSVPHPAFSIGEFYKKVE